MAFVVQVGVVIVPMNICSNIGGKMLQDEKKLERFIKIQEEITKLMNEIHRIQERIYYLARERDSL